MDPITLYTLGKDFEVEEHGVVTMEQAFKTLDKFASIQANLSGSAEHVLSHSIFGLSVGRNTFIEISLEESDYFVVKFETPEKRKVLFLTVPSLYQKEIDVKGKDAMRHLIKRFFDLSLNEFKDTFHSIWKEHRTKPWTHTTEPACPAVPPDGHD